MFLSVVIASERCFCVVSPMRAQRLLKTSTTGVWVSAISFILLAGMLAIAGPKHTVTCLFDPVTNTTSQIVYVTKYADDANGTFLESTGILLVLYMFYVYLISVV